MSIGFILRFVLQYHISYSECTLITIRLADVMFGDESDDDAKDIKKEYTFKPKSCGGRSRKCTVDEDNEEEDESKSENSNESI